MEETEVYEVEYEAQEIVPVQNESRALERFSDAANSATNLVNSANNIISGIAQISEQKTQREKIKAERDIAITKIKAGTQAANKFMDKRFAERSEDLKDAREMARKAFEKGDKESLAMYLNKSVKIHETSVMKEMGDTLKQSKPLLNDDGDMEI